ncbi:hypothetical protein AMTR_s00044p00045120 [Amborella trichopoda]|uniref:Uncharacterized protein n=1 Tax=Amborella trichopoda TaxID=13333 RepID=U5D9K2_AMBTC|nr:hypothetical protein AMTR_s00044p00045120 [Amborella trichopoda]
MASEPSPKTLISPLKLSEIDKDGSFYGDSVNAPEEPPKSVSKKTAKKEAVKAERLKKKQEMAASAALVDEADPLALHYRDIPLKELQS